MVSWSFLGHRWTGENSNLLNTVLRGEWGFRGMALTDFFRNNGHGFMNADAALANGVDAMLSTLDGPENNVADRSHPTSVKQMRNACKMSCIRWLEAGPMMVKGPVLAWKHGRRQSLVWMRF